MLQETYKGIGLALYRGVRHLLKSCMRFRNQLDFQLISDFKLDFKLQKSINCMGNAIQDCRNQLIARENAILFKSATFYGVILDFHA